MFSTSELRPSARNQQLPPTKRRRTPPITLVSTSSHPTPSPLSSSQTINGDWIVDRRLRCPPTPATSIGTISSPGLISNEFNPAHRRCRQQSPAANPVSPPASNLHRALTVPPPSLFVKPTVLATHPVTSIFTAPTAAHDLQFPGLIHFSYNKSRRDQPPLLRSSPKTHHRDPRLRRRPSSTRFSILELVHRCCHPQSPTASSVFQSSLNITAANNQRRLPCFSTAVSSRIATAVSPLATCV